MMPDPGHDMPGIVEHFERTLGLIQEVWALDLDGLRLPFQIARFAGGSDEDSVGYATLGLSRHLLVSAVTNQTVREEFLMLAPKAVDPHLMASLLHQVAARALEAHHAYRHGDVLGPANALIPGSDLTAL